MAAEHRFHLELGDRIVLAEAAPAATVEARFLGGFGEVYVLREDTERHGRIAAKVPRADRGLNQDVLDQFAREALIWKELPAHPNVLPAYGVRLHNEWPFASMKYVGATTPRGASLGAYLESDRPGYLCAGTKDLIVLLGTQLIHGLADLERVIPEFVHGDLKPANLLLDDAPDVAASMGVPSAQRILISDFGLSRTRASSEIGRPFDGGSYRYLAPECFEGTYGQRAQDIYAIGCTLFELILGVCYQVYDARTDGPALLSGGVTADDLQRKRSDVPRSLLELVLLCVRPRPQDRPGSFIELEGLWKEVLQGSGHKTVVVKPTGDGDPDWLGDVKTDSVTRYLHERRGMVLADAADVVRAVAQANQLTNLRQFEAAFEALNRVLERIPKFAPALASMGYALTVQRRPIEAIGAYTAAYTSYATETDLIEADGLGFGAVCATLAQLHATGENASPKIFEVASALASLAVKYLPQSAKCQLAQGMVYLRYRHPGARQALERALEIDSSNRRVRVCLGAVRLSSSVDVDAAIVQAQLGLTDNEMSAVQSLLAMQISLPEQSA